METRLNNPVEENKKEGQQGMEALSVMEEMLKQLEVKKVDAKTYSPLALAYMGDAVYEIIIRTMIVSRANQQVNKYHKKASSYVKAESQAKMIIKLEPYLTEEEEAVYKRGRNAKSYTSAKNASIIDYRMATGFEALVGYLYLKNDWKRLMELLHIGLFEQ